MSRRVWFGLALGCLSVAAGCAVPATGPDGQGPQEPSAPAVTAARVIAPLPATVAGGALADSTDSTATVQAQYRSGACHQRGSGPLTLPDPRCTPGALNPAVTQATITSTICRPGYTRTIRPASSVTSVEKVASLAAYGDPDEPAAFEYDHLVSLELGGAANDPRNLWPEPGASPNTKDRLENRLHALVCAGQLSLGAAQRAIAVSWVTAYRTYVSVARTTSLVLAPPPSHAVRVAGRTASGPQSGATARCNDGTYSYAAHHQGACSHHHGVALFYR